MFNRVVHSTASVERLTLRHGGKGHRGQERCDEKQSNRLVEARRTHFRTVLEAREQRTNNQREDDVDHQRSLEDGWMAGQVGQAALGEQQGLCQGCSRKLGRVLLLELGQKSVAFRLLVRVGMLGPQLGEMRFRVCCEVVGVLFGKVLS